MLPQRQRRISAWHGANYRMHAKRLHRNQHLFDVGKTPRGSVVAQNAVFESLSSWLEVSPASRASAGEVASADADYNARALRPCWPIGLIPRPRTAFSKLRPADSVSKRSSPRDGRAGCWRKALFASIDDLQAELHDARLKSA
jgi:hypothetical protein